MELVKGVTNKLTEDELDKLNYLSELELDLRLELHSIKYKVNATIKDLELNGININYGSREWMKGLSFQYLKSIYLKTHKLLNFLYEQYNRKYTFREIQNGQPGDYLPF
jgi:hypothetical protein